MGSGRHACSNLRLSGVHLLRRCSPFGLARTDEVFFWEQTHYVRLRWTCVKVFVYIADTDGTPGLGCQREGAESGSTHLDARVRLGPVPATAPVMLARIKDVDENGPPANQELFKWLDPHRHRGHRLCEYKVHHPRACRGYAFQTDRGLVIARIADKTKSDQELSDTTRAVKMLIDPFLEGGEIYE